MYYVMNPLNGAIIGPMNSVEECEDTLKLVEYSKEWIIVKAVK